MAITEIMKRGEAHLHRRAPHTLLVTSTPFTVRDTATAPVRVEFGLIVGFDFRAGVRLGMLVLPETTDRQAIEGIAAQVEGHLDALGSSFEIVAGTASPAAPTHPLSSKALPLSRRLLLYAPRFDLPTADMLAWFGASGWSAEVCDERQIFHSAFISYGGPDVKAATALDAALRGAGVSTWFFPRDALPGQKLHRVMFTGVNSHDRVVLLCSAGSLNRKGVLNELERVLEREAAEGGTEILVPVAIDDYVYSDWAPSRPDIASQVRSRVIARLPAPSDVDAYRTGIEKVVAALQRRPA